MPRFTAEQIYAFARGAGFSPDQAATMTAVALAESGGNSGARNPRGEDSRGLWQINLRAHHEFDDVNLYDPVQNAQAAFAVSHGGADISPWTTTHGGLSARYLRYRAQAESAAMSYGDGPGHGMWAGTTGYGDHTPAGPGGGPAAAGQPPGGAAAGGSGSDAVVNAQATSTPGGPGSPTRAGEQYGIPLDAPPESADALALAGAADPPGGGRAGADYGIPLETATAEPPAPAAPAGSTEEAARLQKFLDVALAQTGDQYIFGAETKLDDPNPSAFDCSELVEWASHQAGVKVPDGAWAQYSRLHDDGSAIPLQQAIDTPGALLFSFSSDPLSGKPKAAHVAISLGDGKTIEAKGTQYGVGSWEATAGRFQYAALIPGLGEGGGPPAGDVAPAPAVDAFDYRLGADPAAMDTEPATVAASLQLTDAAPAPIDQPPQPEPPQPEPPEPEPPEIVEEGEIGTDANVDGIDDDLAQAMHWSSHPDQPIDPDSGDDALAAH